MKNKQPKKLHTHKKSINTNISRSKRPADSDHSAGVTDLDLIDWVKMSIKETGHVYKHINKYLHMYSQRSRRIQRNTTDIIYILLHLHAFPPHLQLVHSFFYYYNRSIGLINFTHTHTHTQTTHFNNNQQQRTSCRWPLSLSLSLSLSISLKHTHTHTHTHTDGRTK